MDNWQPSTLSWSFSKKTHFDSCKRQYFYQRFWGQDPKTRWKLFELKNITTLTMLRGQVVHTVIAKALKSIRYGQEVTPKMVKDSVTAVIREKYAESAKRLWHIDNRPQGRKQADITNLLEHYYMFPNLNERACDAQQIAWKCVENLVESDFWKDIAAGSPSNWMEIDDDSFPSFDLDGIKVYTKVDFAHSDGQNTIIDWKTGAPSGNDRLQLTLYSLYGQWQWGWSPMDTRLAAVYLQPELNVEIFSPTPEEIEVVKETVRSSFQQMMDLEPVFDAAQIEEFPISDDPSECSWCRFRGVCEGARRDQRAAI